MPAFCIQRSAFRSIYLPVLSDQAMPILPTVSFRPPLFQFNGHLQTIVPSIFRKVDFQWQQRERLELPDGDFVDLDWHRTGTKQPLLIITHGLEGDSGRHYVKGMAKLFTQNGFDVLGWNCRSCSGEMNRLLRFYHHGDASDLRKVIQHAIRQYQYDEIFLVGFSMGGSLSFRAVAENPDWVPSQVKGVVGFSTPCDLASSVVRLSESQNRIYQKRFLRKLREKIRLKEKIFPGQISSEGYDSITNFEIFDNRYTAPLHGFADAQDFYQRASVKPFLHQVRIPCLLVQSLTDSFLTPECFCEEIAEQHPHLYLQKTNAGGHCGFQQRGNAFTWAEERTLSFISSLRSNAER
jgi:predicted alpha/beta-fold hydrolase